MKPTRENIYVPLEGKSKEELTELYNFLISVGEKTFYNNLEGFLLNSKREFHTVLVVSKISGVWVLSGDKRKTEVTIQQLKEILQPMETKGKQLIKEAKERGYTHDNFKCLRDSKQEGDPNLYEWYYEKSTDILFTNSCGNGGKVVYKEGVWAEIIKPMENKEFDLKGYSVEVDNEEQARQLQEFAFKQGFEWCDGKNVCLLNEKFFSFNAFNDNLIHYDNKHFKNEYVTKEIHFNDIFKTELTLTEQLEKAEAEVKRLKEAIEEESKPKINDWVYNKEEDIIYQKSYNVFNQYEKKITNPQLIILLENEIK